MFGFRVVRLTHWAVALTHKYADPVAVDITIEMGGERVPRIHCGVAHLYMAKLPAYFCPNMAARPLRCTHKSTHFLTTQPPPSVNAHQITAGGRPPAAMTSHLNVLPFAQALMRIGCWLLQSARAPPPVST